MRPTYLIAIMMAILLLPSLPSSVSDAEGAKDEAHDTKHAYGAGKLHASNTIAGLHIELIVEPATIEPNIPVKFSHKFIDSVTGELRDVVPHTFMIMSDGVVIFEEYSEDAAYVHRFTFNEEQTGPITIMISDVNNTGEDAEFSITVVPEFPLMMVVMVGAIASSFLGRFIIHSR